MLTAIEGVYENGQVILTEAPPTARRVKSYVTFADEEVTLPNKKAIDLRYLVGSLTHLTSEQNDQIDRELKDIRDSWERPIF